MEFKTVIYRIACPRATSLSKPRLRQHGMAQYTEYSMGRQVDQRRSCGETRGQAIPSAADH